MSRYRMTADGRRVEFTQAEEDAANAMEAAEALPSALNAFRIARDDCLKLGIKHAGELWHTDAMSQHAYASTIMFGEKYEAATGQTFSTIWKTMTTHVALGIPQLVSAGMVVGGYVQAAFQREADLIAQATGGDIEGALAALETGWPEGGA